MKKQAEPWGTVYTYPVQGTSFQVQELLDRSSLPNQVHGHSTIIIKPNLVKTIPPPVTTPVALVEELIVYLKKTCSAEILLAEGTAAMEYDTLHVFDSLGYTAMAARHEVKLADLNQAPLVTLKRDDCSRWPTMHLPELVMDSFLLSVPVLKAHSFAGVTLTLKNMMGLAPPKHYQRGGWKKSAFHQQIQKSIADLNRYRAPDFTVLDASIGMVEAHLWGPTCDPPPGLVVASADPVAVDAYGTKLLGKDWQDIGHIKSLNGELGQATPLQIIDVSAPPI